MHSTKDDIKRVNRYLHYGPLFGGMTQKGKLYMKMKYTNTQLI